VTLRLLKLTPICIPQTSGHQTAQTVDYELWGVVQKQVYQSRVHDIEELKQRLLYFWHAREQSIIDKAVDKWFMHVCGQREDTE